MSDEQQEPRSLKALAEEALMVQDACNLSGVVKSFGRMFDDLWQHARAGGHGTDWVNQHPIVRLWIDKCASLARTTCGLGDDKVMDAYREVEALIGTEEEVQRAYGVAA